VSLLPWHRGGAAARVEQLLDAGRLPHALLLRAPEGWGASSFGSWLALRLLELEAAAADTAPDAEPAGIPLPRARSLAHPDLRWIEPDGNVIKVDEIRSLAEFAVGTRQSAPRKVAVIERAELMNLNAANALLKTLEEPPPGTHIVLVSSQPGRLLPTIVSRCHAVTLEADADAAEAWLLARWPREELISRRLEYGDAPLTLDAALREGEPLLAPTLAALGRSRQPALEAAALLELDVERLLDRWYRCCVAIAARRLEGPWLAGLDAKALDQFVDELTSTRRQILYASGANVRLLLERLAVRWRRTCASATEDA
jgi:DNA polymerase-3 subunit delta'